MSLRDEYPGVQQVAVMRPAWVGPDGAHSREVRLCPNVPKAIGMFWRDTGQGAWFLDGNDPLWEELELWAPEAPPIERDPVAQRNAILESYGQAQALWEANVKATEWGSDPLWWLPLAHMDPSACWYDKAAKVLRYPYRELLARYGSANIAEYATSKGLPPPRLEL